MPLKTSQPYGEVGSHSNPLVDIECILVRETAKAWLVRGSDRDTEAWIAKSQCELTDHSKATGKRTLTCSEELAVEKRLL